MIVNLCRKTEPTVVAPFPSQGILNCVTVEKACCVGRKQSAGACVLLSTLDCGYNVTNLYEFLL